MKAASRKYLFDMQQACQSIADFMADKSLSDYRTSKLLRSAVERQLIIIGEAMAQVRKLEPSLADRVPDGRRIIAFRNLAVHGYDAINDEVAYTIATRDTVALDGELGRMFSEAPDTESPND